MDRSAGLAAADLKGEKKTGLRVHGKTGQPCPVCGDTIREVSFADSSLQYCPTCQTGGKPLADRRLSRLLKLPLSPRLLPEPTCPGWLLGPGSRNRKRAYRAARDGRQG